MTLGGRRRLFYVLVLVFIAIGGGAVFYAQGWRIDVAAFAVNKVGALYVRPYPSDADISLNHVPAKKSFALFDKGAFIANLFPKRYTLTLTRDGYRTLERHISVLPALVTELKFAVLIPKVAVHIGDATRDVWAKGGALLTQSATGTLISETGAVRGDTVLGTTLDLGTVLTREKKTYFLTDTRASTTMNVTRLAARLGVTLTGNSNETLALDPESGADILVDMPRALILMNSRCETVATLDVNPRAARRSTALGMAAVAWETPTKRGWSLSVYDRLSDTSRDTGHVLPGAPRALAWATKNTLGILQDDGSFYIYDAAADTLEKTASDVTQFFFTADGTMAATLEHRSIEIFSFATDDYWRFNIPNVEEVQSLTWYRDNHHLFVTYPDRTALLDLDDRALEDLATVVDTNRVAYDPESNRFYFIQDGAVKMVEFAK